VDVSSPDKLLFPADGITKAEVVAHYELVGEYMVQFVSGRPLTLQRFPSGIEGKGFMQKNAAAHFPDSIERHAVPKRDGDETVYPVVRRAADLAYLANQNTITFHMWTSSIESPGNPDWMVIDLDPEAGDLGGVRTATRTIRDLLDTFDIDSNLLATGSKGFHVWVPLEGSAGFGEISQSARALAGIAAISQPATTTTEFLKKNRKGRVFIDWLRNAPTATVVAPFSLRPRGGAPLATPLRWDELDTTQPDTWRLGQIEERLEATWKAEPQVIPTEAIISLAREVGVDLDTPHDRFGRTP
jgi:bifunctional non-homologous end joining protein LigD